MDISITHEKGHEYHVENLEDNQEHRDIEVYMDGMFVHSFRNPLSAIGHCLSIDNWHKDIGYVTRNRA